MIPHLARQNLHWGSSLSVIVCIAAAMTIPSLAADYQLRTAPLNPPRPVQLATQPAIPPQINWRSKPEFLWQILYLKPKATLQEVEPFIQGDPNRYDRPGNREDPLLMVAIRFSREDVARILIERGTNVNWHSPSDPDYTPLAAACGRGMNLQFIRYLIARGAKLPAPKSEGWTLLHSAASGGNVEVAQFLIGKGLSVQAAHHRDGTALDVAVGEEKLDMVRFLIDQGAPVNHRDDIGRTPLHRAAKSKNPQLVALLISKGADVNAQDKYHRTPLSLAADADNREVVAVLVRHNAKE